MSCYSQYIKKERETAKMVFAIFIDKVYSASKVKTNVKICEGYLLVENFNLPKPSISIKCHSFLKGLMKKHRIEEYFEKGEYIGIRIFHSQP